MRKKNKLFIGFLCGATLLCISSMLQKLIVGFNPFRLSGYIIPFLFGGISGSIIGFYLSKVEILNEALLARVDTLEIFLSICSKCKKIRRPDSDLKDRKSWQEVESYISNISQSEFSHSICPECLHNLYGKKFSAEILNNVPT